MSKVTFDYSKAKTFIADHEMVSMKKIAEAAKAELLGREGAGMISLDGSIFRLTMIRKSLRGSNRLRQRSRVIQRCFW